MYKNRICSHRSIVELIIIFLYIEYSYSRSYMDCKFNVMTLSGNKQIRNKTKFFSKKVYSPNVVSCRLSIFVFGYGCLGMACNVAAPNKMMIIASMQHIPIGLFIYPT